MKRTGILAALALALTMGGVAPAGELVPNSLADAEVGEWALYSAPNGYQQRLSVIERENGSAAATVTVQIDNIFDNEVVSSAFYSDTAGEALTEAEAPGGGKVSTVTKENFSLGGRTFEATVVKIIPENPADGSTDWWVAAEVPVFGLVKQVEAGTVTLELVDFGKE